ncbi:hypothetical protein PUN28_006819 [Cardiocondyla obscurior]|uniref:COMM domain-containing protein n=1 Tax=Cardiocondyla obscurior TaxID=286306 RepID=A0AAW2G283_9HYME
MATWIEITPKLEQGMKIVTRVDSGKFRLFVNRICQTLQSSVDAKVFNEEEEEKLLVSLDLAKDELILLLDAITSIYKQAACYVVKPFIMETVLKDTFKLDEEKRSIFTSAWLHYGKGIVENFKQQSIFPNQVKDINWSLNVQSSSISLCNTAEAAAMLQLCMTRDRSIPFTTEFNKEQLKDLHEYLEKIQGHLDTLK